jgi:hypothetical protein
MSFQRLEKDIIIPKFNEPRIHFALNCASRSCPPLQAQSFEGGKLDTQLEKLTRAFVNTDSANSPRDWQAPISGGRTAQLNISLNSATS